MGVTAKIIPYKKNKDNLFNKIEVLRFLVYFVAGMADRRYNTYYSFGISDLYLRESQYGLTGRIMRGKLMDSSGNYVNTYAFITGFAEVGVRAYITHSGGWSNGLPEIGTAINIVAYQKPEVRYEDINAEISIDNVLLEDNIIMNYRSESNRVLDVEYSFGEVTIDETSEIKDFFNTYWRDITFDVEYEYIFGLQILLNGVPEAWLCFKRSDITYDGVNQNYKIKCYDWVKNQLTEIGGEKTPLIFIVLGTLTLAQYLLAVFENFGNTLITEMDIDVKGMSQYWNGSEYKAFQHYYEGTNFQWISVGDLVTVEQFLENVQRHYAGYVYYTPDKKLAFKSRDAVGSAVTIDNIIEEETFEEMTRLKDYSTLLINFKSWLLDGTIYSGWAFVSEDRGGTYYLKIEYGLSSQDIDKKEGHLDLRYDLPEPYFEYPIFPVRTPGQFYDDYKTLLRDSKIYICNVDSLDIKLFDEVIYKTFAYKVINIRKDYIRESSEIEMTKRI